MKRIEHASEQGDEGMIKHKLVIVAALAAYAGVAQAEAPATEAGFYARAYGGLSTLNDSGISTGGANANAKFSSGLMVGGAVGYDYAGPWRSEIEYTYRSSDVDSLPTTIAREGDYASTAIMVNGLYSFGTLGAVQPYVGAGVGFVREVDFDLTGGPAAGEYSDSGLLAGQVILGADLALGQRWTAFGEVRAFFIDDPNLPGAAGRKLRAQYQTIDFLLGASLRF
jgi:opacity protein-like surface antigen